MSGDEMNGLDVELLAASLRAEAADMPAWVAVLGSKLGQALPSRVQVQRSGFFGGGPITGFAADLGEYRYVLHLEHGAPIAERAHVVRGIALKNEPLPLDAWVQGLTNALAQLASTSARERAAILGLLQ